ncbi:sensor histidine kinase [Bacillus halotolerans]|uniref:histidine kinase n=1 Tax=Bacillus halotolerans TaxID=260554 RepID=A0A9Q4EJX7_9BACI|nr:sensor histidine kinase [Bacillus halotolerans]MCY9185025.1 sensor histidine kinase [Bacillus halotolerans]MCY9202522.1 sensor histidine kinase [Bacillus halotolerans]
MKGRVAGWYRRMKIKDKLFVFLSLIMAVSFLFVYSGVQYAFHVYDEQIYRKSSEVLRMSSERIEDELKKIEDVSYEIITDEQIQRILSMQNRDDTYDQYQMKQELWDQLAQYAGDEKYIDSIHLIDARGSEYSAGSSSSDLMKQQEEVFERAKAQKGRNLWMTLGNSDPVLISARQIRSFHQLSLNGLGMVLIQVNVKQMIRDLPKDWGDSVGDMMIADKDGNLVYSAHASVLTPEMTKQTLRHPGYDLVKKNGKRYFISFLQSSYQNWSYYNVIPFDQMFAKISFMKTVIGTCFLLFFSVVLLFGRKIANSITEPIEQLVSAMKSVQHGGIEAGVSLSLPEHTQDEAGTLNRHFTVMMKRINELMEENVEKQLIIKETELKALQAQINPHFLYNTLESINWLAKANQQKQISQMVESLGFLLRNSIHIKEDTVTLQEEADIVLHYMTIQRFRFEERLNFTLDIADEVKHCRIPKLTLQPLAENAIQYALEPFTRPCAIRLQAKKTEDCVCITVEDNGPGMDETILEKTGGRGIGLWNIHERIRLMFGEPYGLRIQSEKGKGTAILLTIPCRNEVV